MRSDKKQELIATVNQEEESILPMVRSQRVYPVCQEVPQEDGVAHRDHVQLVRGEAHLANWLTVAYESLIRTVSPFNKVYWCE